MEKQVANKTENRNLLDMIDLSFWKVLPHRLLRENKWKNALVQRLSLIGQTVDGRNPVGMYKTL